MKLYRSLLIACIAIALIIGIGWWYRMGRHTRIHTITEIESVLPHAFNRTTLVVFDIDDTLITPENRKASSPWFEERLRHYKQKGLSQKTAIKNVLREHLRAHETSTFYPVEENDTKAVIEALDRTDIPILVLTARSHDFAPVTQKQFDATHIELPTEDSPWPDVCLKLPGTPAVHYTPGILFAGGGDKGAALTTFLDHVNAQPRRIIFIDDKKDNVRDVITALQKRNIPVYGFYYPRVERNAERGYAAQTQKASTNAAPKRPMNQPQRFPA